MRIFYSLVAALLLHGCNFLEVSVHTSQRSVLTDGNDDENKLIRGDDNNDDAEDFNTTIKIPFQ